jgi:AraC-like DNA-binding protein
MKTTIEPAHYEPGDFLERPIILRAFDMEAGVRVAPHRHRWGQLAYASQGIIIVSTENGRWMVPPERAVWIPPDVAHAVNTTAKAKFRSVHISAEHSRSLPSDCQVVVVSQLLRELIFRAESISRDYAPNSSDSRLMSVILDQIREADQAPLYLPMPLDKRLSRITDILLDEPANNQTLKDFSEKSGASERTLARLFKKETGLTFGKWRQQRRLLAALELLAQGNSVTTVALDLGYESVSAFIAMFKLALGTTPTRYFEATNTKLKGEAVD